jgi:hypothetical protein
MRKLWKVSELSTLLELSHQCSARSYQRKSSLSRQHCTCVQKTGSIHSVLDRIEKNVEDDKEQRFLRADFSLTHVLFGLCWVVLVLSFPFVGTSCMHRLNGPLSFTKPTKESKAKSRYCVTGMFELSQTTREMYALQLCGFRFHFVFSFFLRVRVWMNWIMNDNLYFVFFLRWRATPTLWTLQSAQLGVHFWEVAKETWSWSRLFIINNI